MEPNVVTKVVTDEVGITAKVINGLENFAFNRGIDLLEAIIIFIVGYVICRYIRQGIIKILEKGRSIHRPEVSSVRLHFSSAWPSLPLSH